MIQESWESGNLLGSRIQSHHCGIKSVQQPSEVDGTISGLQLRAGCRSVPEASQLASGGNWADLLGRETGHRSKSQEQVKSFISKLCAKFQSLA